MKTRGFLPLLLEFLWRAAVLIVDRIGVVEGDTLAADPDRSRFVPVDGHALALDVSLRTPLLLAR